MRKFRKSLSMLPLKWRILAISYLTVVLVASAAGIPLLAIGIMSHQHWMEVVGISLLVLILVENAIIMPVLRMRVASRRTKPPA